MVADLVHGLLPSQLLLALVLLLMLFEIARVDARWGRFAFAFATAAGAGVLIQQIAAGYTADIVAGEVRVDRFSLLAKLVLVACGLLLACCFGGRGSHKFWLLVASSLLGGLVVMDSAGFASLFIGIELLSLPAFALMVHDNGRTPASEGAFKYLVLSSVASALLLFGVALAYGVTGSLSIAPFAEGYAGGGAQARAAALLVLCGLFLKAAVFPFHAWAPDAYSSARLPVTAMMASLVKAAVVLALVRIVAGTRLDAASAVVVASLAVVSIFYGNIAALGQQRLKRLLAYSSVAHAGYMVIALVDTTGNRAHDLLWYVAFYALATLVACAAYAQICPDSDDSGDELQALDGKFSSHPVAALLLGAAVLSLAGMPPLPGFFAKLFVFRSVVASGHFAAAVVAFVGSFLGLAYYLGIVVRLFRNETVAGVPAPSDSVAVDNAAASKAPA